MVSKQEFIWDVYYDEEDIPCVDKWFDCPCPNIFDDEHIFEQLVASYLDTGRVIV